MAIDNDVLDQLLAGRDPGELFAKDGLLDELKKALFDLAVAAMIATVPKSSSVNRMIRARHTCFCGEPRAATSASSRTLFDAVTTMLIPVRTPHRRTGT